ncbi:MAG: hypothetical protein QM773_13850 [Hyphomonadaceae bacterium]
MMTLPNNAKTVAQLIRLMASDRPGEQVAAVEGMRRTLAAHDLDFNDLAAWVERMAAQDAALECHDWLELASGYLRQGMGVLHARDIGFLQNIAAAAAQGREPSEGQQKWLNDIKQKLEAARVRSGGRRGRAA